MFNLVSGAPRNFAQKFGQFLYEVLSGCSQFSNYNIDSGFLSNGGTSLQAFYVIQQLVNECALTENGEQNVVLKMMLADLPLKFVQSQCVSFVFCYLSADCDICVFSPFLIHYEVSYKLS